MCCVARHVDTQQFAKIGAADTRERWWWGLWGVSAVRLSRLIKEVRVATCVAAPHHGHHGSGARVVGTSVQPHLAVAGLEPQHLSKGQKQVTRVCECARRRWQHMLCSTGCVITTDYFCFQTPPVATICAPSLSLLCTTPHPTSPCADPLRWWTPVRTQTPQPFG